MHRGVVGGGFTRRFVEGLIGALRWPDGVGAFGGGGGFVVVDEQDWCQSLFMCQLR